MLFIFFIAKCLEQIVQSSVTESEIKCTLRCFSVVVNILSDTGDWKNNDIQIIQR